MQSRKGAKTQRSTKNKYGILSAVGLALVTTGCGEPVKVESAGVAPSSAAVSTVTAAVEQWPSLYERTGTVRSRQAARESERARRAKLDAKIAQAEQEVRTAEVSRSYAEVEAPFAGVVTAKTVEPGTLAGPGTPLLTIEGDGYRLEASVEESRAVRA